MIETQVLIQEIQRKHQLTLKPDDPVFVAVTLNDLLLSHYLEKFQAMLEAQNKLVVSEGIERLNQASAMGSEMINQSLEALSQTLAESAVKIANDIQNGQYQDKAWQAIRFGINWGVYAIVACIFFGLGVVARELAAFIFPR